jgi:hypothetical protein
MDRIIFGDNQFFGVNHMSEQAAIRQMKKFRTADDIYETLVYVNSIGIKSFMFTTHDKLEPVFEKIKTNPDFKDFKLIPCMPYAHKYANAMVELGIVEAIGKFVPGSKIMSGLKGLKAAVSSDPVPIMKLLVDSEMKQFKGMNVEAIFLLNIVTDLLLGMGMHNMFYEFAMYTKEKYGVKAGFFTMNYAKLNKVLVDELGLEKPMICSNVNKIGFRMNPSQKEVEEHLGKENSYNIAMSFLASGAVRPKPAVEYLRSLNGIDSVLFGASSPSHIKETKELLETLS